METHAEMVLKTDFTKATKEAVLENWRTAQIMDTVRAVNLVVNWRGFNRNHVVFDVERTMPVVFRQYNYKVNVGKSDSQPAVEKLYHLGLTKSEIKLLKDAFIREVVALIKEKSSIA